MPQPDAGTTAEALALVQAQAQAREQLVDLTQAGVRAELAAFTGWYDSAKITALASRLAKLTRAAQRQTATSTDAYAKRIVRLLAGRSPSSAGPVKVDGLWGGVPMESVYGRLADEYRWLQATRGPDAPVQALVGDVSGKPLPRLTDPEILDRVLARGEGQADMALTLALRTQWVDDLAKAGTVTGYRRVIHPEESRTGTCGLCIAASDMIYKRSELQPIHENCRCLPVPIVGDPLGPGDPGSSINAADLERIYGHAGGSTNGRDLKKVRYVVHAHGELGPILRVAGQHFRGPKEAA